MKKVTIWLDGMGCLHIFEGHNKKLTQIAKYSVRDIKGNEAPLYFQFEDDIKAIKENLTKKQLNNLKVNSQINAKVDSLYFSN